MEYSEEELEEGDGGGREGGTFFAGGVEVDGFEEVIHDV